MYEVCGEKELKVVLALDPEDSISGVARKIDENRETIRRVVHRLGRRDTSRTTMGSISSIRQSKTSVSSS